MGHSYLFRLLFKMYFLIYSGCSPLLDFFFKTEYMEKSINLKILLYFLMLLMHFCYNAVIFPLTCDVFINS